MRAHRSHRVCREIAEQEEEEQEDEPRAAGDYSLRLLPSHSVRYQNTNRFRFLSSRGVFCLLDAEFPLLGVGPKERCR
jgi:hypothetical protein